MEYKLTVNCIYLRVFNVRHNKKVFNLFNLNTLNENNKSF